MTEQFQVRHCGGSIQHTGHPQEIAGSNPDRVGGYVANNSAGVLHVLAGEAIALQSFRGVSFPPGYTGPVAVLGDYEQRFAAVEFVKDMTETVANEAKPRPLLTKH
jgi:hypothetical protein